MTTAKTKQRSGSKSSNAMQQRIDSLNRAVGGQSFANYESIFEGFLEKGIPEEQIKPRENVFTFNAWKALGRVVKKGETGVKVFTVIECVKKDKETGEEIPVKRGRTTTVFHITQTKKLDDQDDAAPEPAPEDNADQDTEPASEEATTADAANASSQATPTGEPEVTAEPNAYELRQLARKERYQNAALKASSLSRAAHMKARNMTSVIPFGQPILIGHHSERRDRNYRKKIAKNFGTAFELQDKAAYYEDKAAGVGTAGISSDDPAAIKKLRDELASVEHSQKTMKAVNAALRANKEPEAAAAALVALGFNEDDAANLIKIKGFRPYALGNNNANARRIKLRIAQLEKLRAREPVEVSTENYTYREDSDENRVMFLFPEKPSEEIRKVLKKHAFKFSPSRNGAWVRQLNNAGLWAAGQVRNELRELVAA